MSNKISVAATGDSFIVRRIPELRSGGALVDLIRSADASFTNLETANGRVALIGVTASYHAAWAAGEQRPDGPGRPGVNPLRYSTVNYVSAEELEQLRRIAETSGINDARKLSIAEGFTAPDKEGTLNFAGTSFAVSADGGARRKTETNKTDAARIKKAIAEAARRAGRCGEAC